MIRLAFIALLVSVGLLALWSLGTGSGEGGIPAAIDVLLNPDDGRQSIVVWQVRLPRALAAMLVGAALAVAGAIMQAVTGNPLASPGLLGVNAGAAFGVVMGLSLLNITAVERLIWFAFAGAALAAVLVYGLSSIGRTRTTPLKLVLSGVVVTTFLGALTTSILLLDAQTLDTIRHWTAGAVRNRQMAEILPVVPYLAIALVLSLATADQYTTMSLGQVAQSLGQNQRLWRGIAAVCVVGLAGSAVSIAGPVGFVGLIVPHMVRMTVGTSYSRIIPFSAVGGAALLLLADTFPRAVSGVDLPVGVTVALIGAPFFIWLARGNGVQRT